MKPLWVLLSIGTVSLLASGSPGCNGSSVPLGVAEGGACADGADCADSLFCRVAAPPGDGVCTQIPAACGAPPTCGSGCFDEFDLDCANGSICLSIGGNVTHSCN